MDAVANFKFEISDLKLYEQGLTNNRPSFPARLNKSNKRGRRAGRAIARQFQI
jgi:hypothetical protein